jgi:hypothetical protein
MLNYCLNIIRLIILSDQVTFFSFIFFFVVLGLELRAYTLSHSSSPLW